MINKLPVIGWVFSIVASISMSVPFWVCWTWLGIGQKYFYRLPEVYLTIGFWDCVSLFIVISILKGVLTPQFFSVSQSNTSNTNEKAEKA